MNKDTENFLKLVSRSIDPKPPLYKFYLQLKYNHPLKPWQYQLLDVENFIYAKARKNDNG